MVKRLPASPPVISGFSYISPLGAGGFADVFLFASEMPRRMVAVKVLLKEFANKEFLKLFIKEADTMAALSSHPSIVTIFESGISADGRPYLVMERCPDSYGTKYRSEQIPLQEVLRVGIKIGSALDTAHRSGVLHRDIKPANILLSEYGAPLLSDFGISEAIKKSDTEKMLAMSVPWSAPEVVAEKSSGSIASEVWSLGATIYSLLAGVSPFEKPGKGMNARDKLKARIQKAAYTPVEREGVPPRLQTVLKRAMHKNPLERHQSVFELVTDLQIVQQELGFEMTPHEVPQQNLAAGFSGLATPPVKQSDSGQETNARQLVSRVSYASVRRAREIKYLPSPSDDGIITENNQEPFYKHKWFRIGAGVTIAVIVIFGALKISGLL